MRFSLKQAKGLAVVALVVPVLALVALAPRQSQAAASASATAPAPAAPTMQDAAALYRANCASCHGNDGRGQTAAGRRLGVRDLREKHGGEAHFRNVIANGRGRMPGFLRRVGQDGVEALTRYSLSFN
jgi:mono/diheme cytochrome c family protein